METALHSRLAQCFAKLKVPGPHDRVFKDECMFTFDTPLSRNGLYLNLSTLQSFGEEFVEVDFTRTEYPLYLHTKWTRVPLTADEKAQREAKLEKAAIGVEGGFQVDQDDFTTEKTTALVLLPDRTTIPLPEPELPLQLQHAIIEIERHEGAAAQQQTTAWEEKRIISQYADDLPQLENGKKISMDPSTWICEDSGMRENLWLNLSTGYIGSGRPLWDGSGGTGAALKHYQSTGRQYPLAVKLGTIAPAGADVYSYAPEEDDMVIDPKLETHLRHWGIDMKQMEKTVKTMQEMNFELNLRFEFHRIVEASTKLVPVHGPCYVGLENLGNSCYMNAVLQVLWMVQAVRERYLSSSELIFMTSSEDPSQDLFVQMTKLGNALVHGKTGRDVTEDDSEKWSVRPLYFKTLVGKGHDDFSTGHQQDSAHYFMHLLEVMDTAERINAYRLSEDQSEALTSKMFAFQTEERLFFQELGKVRYKTSQNLILALDIPLEMATNKTDVDHYHDRQMKRQKLQESGADAEILIEPMENGVQKIVELTQDDEEEKVIPKVPFSACLSHYVAETEVEGYSSEELRRETNAVKSTKVKTFPPYLMVQLNRFALGDGGEPKKMEVLVEPPEELLLEGLRAEGPKEGEVLMEEEAAEERKTAADPKLVESLLQIGFNRNGCIRAAIAVDNVSLEAATEWILNHEKDKDFTLPIEEEGGDQEFDVDPETAGLLAAMGFDADAAAAALIEKKNNTEDAVHWLVENGSQLKTIVPSILARHASKVEAPTFLDGIGRYELVGFISHMGSSTACGHYVCHIKKSGRWIVFNDAKVAISESPPRELGYMYLYRRQDVEAPSE